MNGEFIQMIEDTRAELDSIRKWINAGNQFDSKTRYYDRGIYNNDIFINNEQLCYSSGTFFQEGECYRIKASHMYTTNSDYERFFIYNADKTYISGIANTDANGITAPTNAKYLRVRTFNSDEANISLNVRLQLVKLLALGYNSNSKVGEVTNDLTAVCTARPEEFFDEDGTLNKDLFCKAFKTADRYNGTVNQYLLKMKTFLTSYYIMIIVIKLWHIMCQTKRLMNLPKESQN